MKRKTKVIILIIGALLSIAVMIFTIVELNTVSGDNLLKASVSFGSFCVDTYRWFSLVSIALLIFWVIWIATVGRVAVVKLVKESKKAAQERREIRQQQAAQTAYQQQQNNIYEQAPIQQQNAPKMMFCNNCGAQIPANSGFCPKCGAKIIR